MEKLKFSFVFVFELICWVTLKGSFTELGRAVNAGGALSFPEHAACLPSDSFSKSNISPRFPGEPYRDQTVAASQDLHGHVLIQVTKAPESLEIQRPGNAEDNHSTTEMKTSSQNLYFKIR